MRVLAYSVKEKDMAERGFQPAAVYTLAPLESDAHVTQSHGNCPAQKGIHYQAIVSPGIGL